MILDPHPDEDEDNRKVCIYARVSTTKQSKDLADQIEYLKKYLVSNGLNPELVFSDIASGMNENRSGLNEMIDQIIKGKISKVVISHKDRLTRFGFDYFEHLFEKFNVTIEVVNLEDEKSFQDEITEDLISIIHHFSMKLYGKRRNKCKELEVNAILMKKDEDK